ncbi:MAG: class E sortase [Propionibacteriaceae bacterium]|nr:class E sortase [Propionibacteriaceae bacterium]
MMATDTAPRRAVAPPRRGVGWFVRGVAGIVGELMITVGVGLGLFVAWQLVWTDVVGDADQEVAVAQLEETFQLPQTPGDPATLEPVEIGKGFAIVRIPRFGAKYAKPLYEGKDRLTLQKGIGHYPETVMPGEIGNFSMAGHRTTYGKPFNKVAELKDGDLVIVETAESYFVYEVYEDLIVLPNQIEVVAPVPSKPDARPTEALMTMTSCHPMFSSRQRWVTHGRLVDTIPHADGLPLELLEVTD